MIKPDLVASLLLDGDIGPLVDHLMDEGTDSGTASMALSAACSALLDPLREARDEADAELHELWNEYARSHGSPMPMSYAQSGCGKAERRRDAAQDALDAAARELYGRARGAMAEWRMRHYKAVRHEKAVRPDLVASLLRDGEVGPLLDHFIDEGVEHPHHLLQDAVETLLQPINREIDRAQEQIDALGCRYWSAMYRRDELCHERMLRRNELMDLVEEVERQWVVRNKTPQTLEAALGGLREWAWEVMWEGDDYALRDKLMELVQEHGGDPFYEMELRPGAGLDNDADNIVTWTRRMLDTCNTEAEKRHEFDACWRILVRELQRDPFKRHEKVYDRDTAFEMFRDGDIGVLLDYFDDEGFDEARVSRTLWTLAFDSEEPERSIYYDAMRRYTDDDEYHPDLYPEYDAARSVFDRKRSIANAGVFQAMRLWRERHA